MFFVNNFCQLIFLNTVLLTNKKQSAAMRAILHACYQRMSTHQAVKMALLDHKVALHSTAAHSLSNYTDDVMLAGKRGPGCRTRPTCFNPKLGCQVRGCGVKDGTCLGHIWTEDSMHGCCVRP